MQKMIGYMFIGALIVSTSLLTTGCTMRISEDTFIAHDEQSTPYTTEFIQELKQAIPNSQVIPVTLETKDQAQLKGFYIDNPKSETVLMFFQGNGMKVAPHSLSVLKTLSQLDTDILIVDRRGLGASSGKPSIENLMADAQLQLDYLHQHYQPKKVILHGYSLGSFIAAQLAKNNQVNGLVMHGSATNVDDWADEKTPWYMPFMTLEMSENFRKADNARVVAQDYLGPLLVIGAEDDEEVPVELSEKLFAASQSKIKTLVIVPNANHQDMLKDDNTIKAYRTFIEAL
jgi:pimeloyl-ACP methyl ester carboxylesterase